MGGDPGGERIGGDTGPWPQQCRHGGEQALGGNRRGAKPALQTGQVDGVASRLRRIDLDRGTEQLQPRDDALGGRVFADGVRGEDDGFRAERDGLAQPETRAHAVPGRFRGRVEDDGAAALGGPQHQRRAIELRAFEERDAQGKMGNDDTGDGHGPSSVERIAKGARTSRPDNRTYVLIPQGRPAQGGVYTRTE